MRTSKLGLILIAVGIFVLLGNFGIMEGSFFLLAVGAAFVFSYVRSSKEQKPYGLLIPGMLTLGLGTFSMIEPFLGFLEGGLFFAIMGIAFMAVHITHMRFNGVERATKWAGNLGLGLIAFGGFVTVMEFINLPLFHNVQQFVFPALLIGGGAFLLFGKGKVKSETDF